MEHDRFAPALGVDGENEGAVTGARPETTKEEARSTVARGVGRQFLRRRVTHLRQEGLWQTAIEALCAQDEERVRRRILHRAVVHLVGTTCKMQGQFGK